MRTNSHAVLSLLYLERVNAGINHTELTLNHSCRGNAPIFCTVPAVMSLLSTLFVPSLGSLNTVSGTSVDWQDPAGAAVKFFEFEPVPNKTTSGIGDK